MGRICQSFFLICVAATYAAAQSPSVEQIVSQAVQRANIYTDTFRNLISEEKKTFDVFDKKGEVKKRRTVISTFLVYQLSRNDQQIVEFRNVTSVDGKRVGNVEGRAKDFFEKVVASQSSQVEAERIRDESTRFDEDFAINGLTLFPAIALSDQLRPSFTFTLVGRENLAGHDVYVVAFEQSKPHPSITVNSTRIWDGMASHNYDIEIDKEEIEFNARIRGKFWIDSDTFNIRREVREREIQPAGFAQPVVVAEDIFDYTDSEFGILTPKKISHMQYLVKIGDREVRKDTRIDFEYGKFTRPDVEVKSSDIKAKDH